MPGGTSPGDGHSYWLLFRSPGVFAEPVVSPARREESSRLATALSFTATRSNFAGFRRLMPAGFTALLSAEWGGFFAFCKDNIQLWWTCALFAARICKVSLHAGLRFHLFALRYVNQPVNGWIMNDGIRAGSMTIWLSTRALAFLCVQRRRLSDCYGELLFRCAVPPVLPLLQSHTRRDLPLHWPLATAWLTGWCDSQAWPFNAPPALPIFLQSLSLLLTLASVHCVISNLLHIMWLTWWCPRLAWPSRKIQACPKFHRRSHTLVLTLTLIHCFTSELLHLILWTWCCDMDK